MSQALTTTEKRGGIGKATTTDGPGTDTTGEWPPNYHRRVAAELQDPTREYRGR